MWRLITIMLSLAVFCLGAAVSYFNWTTVTFNYLAGQAEMPLIALLLAAFVLGVLVTGLLDFARIFMLRRDQRRQQRQIRELEAELRSLRNLPLANSPAPSNLPAKNA